MKVKQERQLATFLRILMVVLIGIGYLLLRSDSEALGIVLIAASIIVFLIQKFAFF